MTTSVTSEKTQTSTDIWPTATQLFNAVFPLVALVEPELILPKVAFDVVSSLYRKGEQHQERAAETASH